MCVKMKWCGYHQRMEPVSNFQSNSCASDKLQNACRKVHTLRVQNWRYSNYNYVLEYNRIYSAFRRGVISLEEKTFFHKKLKVNNAYIAEW
jgi:hypothetical protein